MPHFITPSPAMSIEIIPCKYNLLATVNFTSINSLKATTTMRPDIQPGDHEIELLKRKLVHQTTQQK